MVRNASVFSIVLFACGCGGDDQAVDAMPVDATAADAPGFDAVSCADAQVEPNDTLGEASITPIPDLGLTYDLAGLVICTSDDVDLFRFRVDDTGSDIVADIFYTFDDGELDLSILNASGIGVRAGSPFENDPDQLRADLLDIPAGTYYVRVASSGTATNGYDLAIATTPP